MPHDYSRPDTDFPGSLSDIKSGGILSPNQETKTTLGSASHPKQTVL